MAAPGQRGLADVLDRTVLGAGVVAGQRQDETASTMPMTTEPMATIRGSSIGPGGDTRHIERGERRRQVARTRRSRTSTAEMAAER